MDCNRTKSETKNGRNYEEYNSNLPGIKEEPEYCDCGINDLENHEQCRSRLSRRKCNKYRGNKFSLHGNTMSQTNESSSDYDDFFASSKDYLNSGFKEIRSQMTLEAETAAGDNDDRQWRTSDKSLESIVDRLKIRLVQSEKKIISLKKHLNAERLNNHQVAIKCWAKCSKNREELNHDLRGWKDNLDSGIQTQMIQWQTIFEKSLHKKIKDWLEEELIKRMNEFDRKDGLKNDNQIANMKRFYGKIQKHLGNLDKRNEKAYIKFRQYMNIWETKIKDEMIKLHENSLIELQQLIELWLPGSNEIKPRPTDPSLDSTLQQPCSDHGCNTILPDDGPEILTKLQVDCIKELRKIEQNLKFEIQDYRKDLYKLVNEKISQIRMGFEEFKHNINLDQLYRKQNYRKYDPEESDSINSDTKMKKSSNTCYGNIGEQNK